MTMMPQDAVTWSPQFEKRLLQCRHRTTYKYGERVERSRNLLRLLPRTDRRQNVRDFDLSISPTGKLRPYDDALGNHVLEFTLDAEHDTLTILSTSTVAVTTRDPFARLPSASSLDFPLTWSEPEIQVLHPYIATGIGALGAWQDLAQYAHNRSKENSHNVTETIFSLNLEIFRTFKYDPAATVPGAPVTGVFQERRGVCQDFTMLLICWARTLGLPARYVWGYLLVGTEENEIVGGHATHAWAEIFLPRVGWLGLDPTNGVLADHRYIAVAHGRSWEDSPPIIGEIEPAQPQELDVEVEVWSVETPEGIVNAAPPSVPS